MSGARRVAGVRERTGRRVCADEDPCVSKKEASALRAAFHDFLREHGEVVKPARKPSFGKGAEHESSTERRAWREDWQERFLLAYERSGNVSHAAKMVGVSERTVEEEFRGKPEFGEACASALGRHVWRLACRAVQKRTRLELPAREVSAFMGHVQRLLQEAGQRQAKIDEERLGHPEKPFPQALPERGEENL